MTDQADLKANIIPSMCYSDAPAAIDWLCDVLGFERRFVVPGENGTIAHARLTLGNGMIMLGSAREGDPGALVFPATPGGKLTQATLIIVADVEAHHERVKAAGANIVMELEEQFYGGSLYAVRDPEGQLWHVGSHDPWA